MGNNRQDHPKDNIAQRDHSDPKKNYNQPKSPPEPPKPKPIQENPEDQNTG